jgi:hypothetical protein
LKTRADGHPLDDEQKLQPDALKGTAMPMHPIIDKGEVAIDFPDKYYSGGFGRDCSFEARAEDDGALIRLVRSGSDKRAVAIHLHHFLLAGILEELAGSIAEHAPIDTPRAAARGGTSLGRRARASCGAGNEQVVV